MSTSNLPTIQTRLKQPYQDSICIHCKAAVEWLKPESGAGGDEGVILQCVSCRGTWVVRPPPTRTGKGNGKRRIGTDERPLDLGYYELLGLPPTCTTDEIKKAYRRLAIRFHPDKNPDDPKAAERFKEIAIAYSTLSDEGLRHAYNEFGKGKGDGQSEDSMIDPEMIFSQLFGGERFQDIIGTISLGSEMKSAMQEGEEDDEEVVAPPAPQASVNGGAESSSTTTVSTTGGKPAKPILTPEQQAEVARKKSVKEALEKKVAEEKARVREKRVKQLLEKLRYKIAVFTEQAVGEEDEQIANGVRTMWTIEAEELKQESYGVELLQTVGFVYSSKSKHYLASTGPIPFGLGGWFHSARSTAHILSETVSTVRSAYALKDVFEALSAAEKSGLSDEKKKELEDKAAQMGLQALFKGAKLEVESVIREVCDRLLSPEEGLSVPDLRKRAVAIGILGSVFESVKKDANSNPPPPPAVTGSEKDKAGRR